jgi:hypothetical protein
MNQSAHFRPKARSDGIVFEQIDDGAVVFDEHASTAHYLSGAAAAVWERADGERSEAAIAAELGLAPEMMEQAVAELVQTGLLEESSVGQGYSRRQAAIKLAQAGGAAFTAPLIYSVAVPASAFAAASCIGKTSPNCGAGKSATKTSSDCTCTSGGTTAVCYDSGQGIKGCVPSTCIVAGKTTTVIGNCCCSSLTGIGETKCTTLSGGKSCPD